MVRISKKDRLKKCPRKPSYGFKKTGPLKDKLAKGYKEHANAYPTEGEPSVFISKLN